MAKKQVLLLGNGMNRCFEKASWVVLIKEIQKEFNCEYDYEQIEDMPFSMQIVAASGDHVDLAMKSLAKRMLNDKICARQRDLLGQLLKIPFDTLLTTNYTFEIEQALGCPAQKGHYTKAVHYIKKCTSREKKFGLYKCFCVGDREIWHIHGDLQAPSSIIMGQYYYGKALREYQNYLSSFIRRYHSEYYRDESHSWLDDFMTGDVHMLGIGMHMSESDLWWLINCKKRNFPDSKVIYYMPSFESCPKREILLKSYGVEISKVQCKSNDYIDFYKEANKKIMKSM